MSLFRRNKRAREDGDEAAATQPGLAGADHHTDERTFAPGTAPSAATGSPHREVGELDALVGEAPSSRRRGKLRRRLRHLRRVREVLLRDLGGLTFELHRTGSGEGGAVLEGKLGRLSTVDREIRDLEDHLSDHRAMIVREPGIGGTCAACGELFGSEARYCWACGNPVAAGAGGAPHLAAWTTHPQLAGGTPAPAPAPAAPLQAPSVDSTWVEHAAEEPPTAPLPQTDPANEPAAATAEEQPTAPLPRMDPATVAAAAEAPAANEPATGDVGGDAGAVWSDHMPASPQPPPAERAEHAAPDVSSGDPLASPQRPAQS